MKKQLSKLPASSKRNPVAGALQGFRRQVFHDKREERGGARNTQDELLQEYDEFLDESSWE